MRHSLVVILSALTWYTVALAVSPETLEKEIAARISRVDEFRFLRDEAKSLGVRVYLFGGTAAGFGHYVKWDLDREGGEIPKTSPRHQGASPGGKPRYQPSRFDYDYTNIYRSTQDLDIVIDGPPSAAKALQQQLQEKYRHVTGSKSLWEVRLLRTKMDDKDALLDNPDFLDQHTDSNSTGLIEISEPPAGESIVRDVRDWDSARPNFLEDIRLGKLHYYFSRTHGETPRAKAGLNPPIFSAIRYLTKVFQYELEISPEDRAKLYEVIRDFDPVQDLRTPYAKGWMEKNAKKLFQHAANLEYAAKEIKALGLKQKLVPLGNPDKQDSLSWWLSRKPLESFPLGSGDGATAKDLELTEVAHETRDFLAYESITRSARGEPNVFVSRTGNVVGEQAAFGEGFYTRIGKKGARNTGYTIRFRLHPDARRGTDFEWSADEFIVVKNRNALEIIPESIDVTPLQFFHLMKEFDASDRGILEKLKRRISGKVANTSPEDKAEIKQLVSDLLFSAQVGRNRNNVEVLGREMLDLWLSFPQSAEHIDFVRTVMDHYLFKTSPFLDSDLLQTITSHMSDPHWVKAGLAKIWFHTLVNQYPDWWKIPSYRNTVNRLLETCLTNPAWRKLPFITHFLETLDRQNDRLKTAVLTLNPAASDMFPDYLPVMQRIFEDSESSLAAKWWAAAKLVEADSQNDDVLRFFLSDRPLKKANVPIKDNMGVDAWKKRSHLLGRWLKKNNGTHRMADRALAKINEAIASHDFDHATSGLTALRNLRAGNEDSVKAIVRLLRNPPLHGMSPNGARDLALDVIIDCKLNSPRLVQELNFTQEGARIAALVQAFPLAPPAPSPFREFCKSLFARFF